MSYVMMRRPYALTSSYSLQALGVPQAASAAAAATGLTFPTMQDALAYLPPCDISTGNASADASFKDCCEKAKRALIAFNNRVDASGAAKTIASCSAKAVADAAKDAACNKIQTGISYIDDAFHDCCEGAFKGSGSVGERTKKLAECTANASASTAVAAMFAGAGTAFCAAAGSVTAGIGTALAASGVCGAVAGTVGLFLYNRISGYSTGALVVGGILGAACGVVAGPLIGFACGIAAAELVDFLVNKLGPLLEGIFDPDAAERREQAERRAAGALYIKTLTSLYAAQEDVVGQWKATIDRIWTLYEKALPSNLRNGANNTIGISNNYESIALALIAASKSFPNQAEVNQYGGYDAAQKAVAGGRGAGIPYSRMSAVRVADIKSRGSAGCDIYGRPGGPFSDVCPIFPGQDFVNETAESQAKHDSAYYTALSDQYSAQVKDFFTMLPVAETIVANKISSYAAGAVMADAVYRAQKLTKDQLALKATVAAGQAEIAANEALHGNAAEGKRAILRAKGQALIAQAAYDAMLISWGASPNMTGEDAASFASRCASDNTCMKTAQALNRAKKFAALAVTNAASATTRRYAVGGTIALGVAGAAFWLLRK